MERSYSRSQILLSVFFPSVFKAIKAAIFIQLFIFGGFSDRLESFCHVQVARQTMSAFH